MEAIAGRFPLSPTMPRVGPSDAESIWRAKGHGVAFAVTPGTIREMPPGMRPPIVYIYAAAFMSETTDGLARIFSLESSLGGSPMFGMFDASGAHLILDAAPKVTDIGSFRRATFEHVHRLEGIESSAWNRAE